MEIIMFSKTFQKIKNFLTEEDSVEEQLQSCKDNISHYRWLAITFGVTFFYTIICSFMFPTYTPSWFPLSESSWMEVRNAWFTYLALGLVNAFFWLKTVIKKHKLLKRLA